ncbi:hypothetical protein MTO96_045520 [Rhipicephalus appendiculatus]
MPRLTRPFQKRRSCSSECSGDDPEAHQVPVTTSLCYAAIVLLTTILALTIGLVLVRLVPDTNGPSRSASAVQGYKAHMGVPRIAIAPPGVAKRMAPATVLHARSNSLLRAVSSANLEKREGEATTAKTVAQGNARNKTVEHPGGLASNSRTAAESVAESSESYRHHLCDIVFYTHCPRTAQEFYFSSLTNSCVRATASYGAEVCNRSPNKFASESSCHKSCVHPNSPSGRCLDRPVFSQCRRCPMDDGDLFDSRESCTRRCLGKPDIPGAVPHTAFGNLYNPPA